jgi:hypothetical protein
MSLRRPARLATPVRKERTDGSWVFPEHLLQQKNPFLSDEGLPPTMPGNLRSAAGAALAVACVGLLGLAISGDWVSALAPRPRPRVRRPAVRAFAACGWLARARREQRGGC